MRSHFSNSGCLTSSKRPDWHCSTTIFSPRLWWPASSLTIFWITPRYGDEGALLVLLELPEAAAVVEELGHRQLHPALGDRHRLAGEALARPRGSTLSPVNCAVHLRHRLVVLGLLADVPDHEAQPLVRDEAQPVAEHVRGRQLAVGLALHQLHDHLPVLGRHLFCANDVRAHLLSFSISRAITSFWISLVPS